MDRANLLGPVNYSEYNVLILDVGDLAGDFQRYFGSDDFFLAEPRFKCIAGVFAKILHWIEGGQILIVLCAQPYSFYARHRVGTAEMNIGAIAPLAWAGMSPPPGARIEYCGRDPVCEPLKAWADRLSYKVVLNGERIEPIYRVSASTPGTGQTVGGYLRHGHGIVLFLPGSSLESPEFGRFLVDAITVANGLMAPIGTLPPWASSFHLPEEDSAVRRRDRLVDDIRRLNSEVGQCEAQIASAQPDKVLFTGTDDELVAAVMRALEGFGFQVVKGPEGKADLIAFHGTILLAIEVEGTTRSPNQRKLTQAMLWRSEVEDALASDDSEADPDLRRYRACLRDLGVLVQNTGNLSCRALLVSNPYRDIPPPERPSSPFPDQLIRTARQQNVCLVTGLQLLGLVLDGRSASAGAEEIRKLLLETDGQLAEKQCWQDILTQYAPPAS